MVLIHINTFRSYTPDFAGPCRRWSKKWVGLCYKTEQSLSSSSRDMIMMWPASKLSQAELEGTYKGGGGTPSKFLISPPQFEILRRSRNILFTMKLFAAALVVAATLADTAAAHCMFGPMRFCQISKMYWQSWADRFFKAVSGGTTYTGYQYIRQNTNTNSPVTASDAKSTDMRCNVSDLAIASTASTQTLTVNAGSTVSIGPSQLSPLEIYIGKLLTRD